MTRTTRSVIEAIGVYLPPKRVTTAEILGGCANPVRVPLERLTGIRVRHLAGESEFSFDLAAKAVADCLERSRTDPDDYDILICANISRYDGPRLVTYEPSTAVRLQKRFGFSQAVAMDVSNACAGMWTAVYVVDAMIRTGAIRRGMVVSGEYISYLTDTAQKEIVDHLDSQLASLTLGDAGVAVVLGVSPRPDVGFHDIELYTLSKYSRYCIAKPTDQAHGGAAMYTDAINVTASVVPHAARHAEEMLRRNDQPLADINHIVPHQTSRLSMQDALKEIGARFDVDLPRRLINNLAERGNTASTSHFLALHDAINSERIQSGDEVLFLISGSGQTTGTALYTCDDLPDRVRARSPLSRVNGAARTTPNRGEVISVPLCIESVAAAAPDAGQSADTLEMLHAASLECLGKSRFSKEQIELLVSVGVFRKEFLTEPAIAALLAGDLEMNDYREPTDEHKTLCFDLLNGGIGFLNACHLVTELSRAGCLARAMIVASELENNADVAPDHLLGLREIGTAVILHEAEDGETGFEAFGFYHYPQHQDARYVIGTWNEQGQPYLVPSQNSELCAKYLSCIEQSVPEFLGQQGLDTNDFRFLLPPQVSPEFVRQVGERLGFDDRSVVNVATDGEDLGTSSTPVAMQAVLERQLAQKGDLGLILNVGSGIQVACATYRF
jgi:3-oxoacyl-[acyl-carrier-protein] synthase III